MSRNPENRQLFVWLQLIRWYVLNDSTVVGDLMEKTALEALEW